MRIISRSIGRKLAVLLLAIVALVLLSETRVLDSRYTAWDALLNQGAGPEPGETLQFVATAYCKGTTTASGVGVRTGIAASDPTLLPVGSVITLATGDARYDGVYTIMDTGPRVQGRTLDLYIWSCHEALRFGRRPVSVTVLRLGWDPSASSPTLVDRLFRARESRRQALPVPDGPPPPASAPPSHAPLAGDPPMASDAPQAGDADGPGMPPIATEDDERISSPDDDLRPHVGSQDEP